MAALVTKATTSTGEALVLVPTTSVPRTCPVLPTPVIPVEYAAPIGRALDALIPVAGELLHGAGPEPTNAGVVTTTHQTVAPPTRPTAQVVPGRDSR